MTQGQDGPPKSAWIEYLSKKAVAASAAQRAPATQEETHEQEAGDEKPGNEAQVDRTKDLVFAREVRAAEIEFERMERERRSIDADTERLTLEEERDDAAAEPRDENLSQVKTDRPELVVDEAGGKFDRDMKEAS
jgi:hypothetical protein